ncbi:MAG: hypothetical protein DMF04_11865 [Verrucomicrobia bacterium]|nr:MAG: hypothetical protein DMF04_11865 [Verrucomicrobiota bacterium]
MTPHNSSGKEKKLVPLYEPLQEELVARIDLTFVSFSELPPLERLSVIENLLRTGASRSSVAAKTRRLQDASISPSTTPFLPSESINKPGFSFSEGESPELVLRETQITVAETTEDPREISLIEDLKFSGDLFPFRQPSPSPAAVNIGPSERAITPTRSRPPGKPKFQPCCY